MLPSSAIECHSLVTPCFRLAVRPYYHPNNAGFEPGQNSHPSRRPSGPDQDRGSMRSRIRSLIPWQELARANAWRTAARPSSDS